MCVIGAGPGGMAAARRLLATGKVAVVLVEQNGASTFLPGIVPVVLGLRPAGAFRHTVDVAGLQVRPGEVVAVEPGRVYLADGGVLPADATIAAPGLVTDASAVAFGLNSISVWELEGAEAAEERLRTLERGRVVVAIDSLPYRCPPAPYGLAMALRSFFIERGRDVDVVLTTPESSPLQRLPGGASAFLVDLVSEARVAVATDFEIDRTSSRDGLLAARDGRTVRYDLGLFVPPHRTLAFLADLNANDGLTPVDAHMRAQMENLWVVGDAAGTPLPRAAGVAEAQGETAAESVLATLELTKPAPPVSPAPSCFVWTSTASAARIEIRYDSARASENPPKVILDPPSRALFTESLETADSWVIRRGV